MDIFIEIVTNPDGFAFTHSMVRVAGDPQEWSSGVCVGAGECLGRLWSWLLQGLSTESLPGKRGLQGHYRYGVKTTFPHNMPAARGSCHGSARLDFSLSPPLNHGRTILHTAWRSSMSTHPVPEAPAPSCPTRTLSPFHGPGCQLFHPWEWAQSMRLHALGFLRIACGEKTSQVNMASPASAWTSTGTGR